MEGSVGLEPIACEGLDVNASRASVPVCDSDFPGGRVSVCRVLPADCRDETAASDIPIEGHLVRAEGIGREELLRLDCAASPHQAPVGAYHGPARMRPPGFGSSRCDRSPPERDEDRNRRHDVCVCEPPPQPLHHLAERIRSRRTISTFPYEISLLLWQGRGWSCDLPSRPRSTARAPDQDPNQRSRRVAANASLSAAISNEGPISRAVGWGPPRKLASTFPTIPPPNSM
jgi:hypothetical protein